MLSSASAKFYALLVIAMISWGFAWPSAKLIVKTQHPNVIIFWRFLATALSLLPVVFWRKGFFRLPNYKVLFQITIGGVLYTIYNQFFLLGLKNGLAGAGGVLVTTMNPIFTYMFVHSFQKKLPSTREGIGLLLGLLGGCILLRLWELDLDSLFRSGNIFFFFVRLVGLS
ncbi:EamA-like transporter family protein [Leptospira weilii serovar Topaz str. LT2116]|uniref:EamA-like transporter family protein n=1 Tax=Leptospira weilii serovar Topaz str. LT2116 TaxID=1088540 RepID=M3H278_9LEPT|nr:EamA-like transporter family protein [Leptospira weilii serovar Topaz str. LT2116]